VIRTAIVGGTGYGGMEMLRLCLGHPELEVTTVTSRSRTGPVAATHPHLLGFTDLAFEDRAPRDLGADHDLVVFATPHGVAAEQATGLLDAHPDVRVIDLSGDHRLSDPDVHAAAYGASHPHPETLAAAVYGLPECGHRQAVRGARLVANPGCHATATILAVWPAVREGLVSGRVAVCSVTGSSGSGAKAAATTHHPERFANFRAYRPLGHQHGPEIEAALDGATVDFVPHSAPLARGISVTAFVPVERGRERDGAAALGARYEGEPLVHVVEGTPEVRAVAGSNVAHVGATAGDGVVCVFVVIDNLGKGMAGTAVQNANLLFGLPETTGLDRPGTGP